MDLFYRKHRWSLKCKLLIQHELLLNCDGSQDTKEEKSKQTISPAKERALNYWYKIAKQCKNAPKKTTWPRLGRPRVATSIQVAGKRNWFRFFDRVQMYQWFLGRIGSIKPWCSWKWYCCWKKKISHTLHRHFPVFARRNSYISQRVNGFFLSTIFPCHVWAGKAATAPRRWRLIWWKRKQNQIRGTMASWVDWLIDLHCAGWSLGLGGHWPRPHELEWYI